MSRAMQEALELLGVARSSDPASVARAYRRLARANHPDVSAEPDAAQRFSRITEAYHLVRDHAPVDPVGDPHPTDRAASPRERFQHLSSAVSSRRQSPDPLLLIGDLATHGPQAWLGSAPTGSRGRPDRPPIVVGPVTVTPPRRPSTPGPRTGEGW